MNYLHAPPLQLFTRIVFTMQLVIKTKTRFSQVIINQHNTGKTKVIINTTAVGKQRCESLKLAQMESTPRSILYKSLIQHSTAWSKSDQPFSRENPGSSGVNNVYAGTKHGWKQWQRCEPGLGKLTTEETRDCSLVFGKRCWAWLHQRQTLPRFPKWLLRSCFSAKCLFSPQNVC